MVNDWLKNNLKNIPKRPGIYQYTNEDGTILYVGKALSLRDRLSSYLATESAKTQELLKNATKISWIETGSNFEALLLEAHLIKLHLPKYNVMLRDDKSYLYIFISTGEDYPKVFTARRPKKFENLEKETYEKLNELKGKYFGPFPSARIARMLLKWLRKTFSYCSQKTLGKRGCFYSHIGLCDPCPSEIEKKEEPEKKVLKKKYRLNISRLKRILDGNIKVVKKELTKEMRQLAKEEKFEDANEFKKQIERIDWIISRPPSTAAFLDNPNFYLDESKKATETLVVLLQQVGIAVEKAEKIECFDISNFQGEQAVASQVVFIHGIPEKNFYRRYKMYIEGKPNDFAMLKEAVTRRLSHKEWEFPDLFVIDGGKGQVSTISQLLKEKGIAIPVIGLAKQFERIIVPTESGFTEIALSRKNEALKLLQTMRDEAHRFGLEYHRKRREKLLL